MESQPQNPEFRKNPENFHPCKHNSKRQKYSGQLMRFCPRCICVKPFFNTHAQYISSEAERT